MVRFLFFQAPLEHRAVLGDGEHGVACVAGERDVHQRLLCPASVGGAYPSTWLALNTRAVRSRTDDDPAAVGAPADARRGVVHAPVLAQRRNGANSLSIVGVAQICKSCPAHRERATARRKLARRNRAFEVHVVQHDAFLSQKTRTRQESEVVSAARINEGRSMRLFQRTRRRIRFRAETRPPRTERRTEKRSRVPPTRFGASESSAPH